MKSDSPEWLYDLPLSELRAHAEHAVRALRIVRAHGVDPPREHADPPSPVPAAVSTLERVVGAFMAPPPTVLARTLWELSPRQRRALRGAIDEEKAARGRLIRLLGEVPASMVEDALAKIEVRERVWSELVAPWRGASADSPVC